MSSFGDDLSLEEKWNMLIHTMCKFYDTTQCSDAGLVSNWALVEEADSNTLANKSVLFSGYRTPQFQFGSKASHTM